MVSAFLLADQELQHPVLRRLKTGRSAEGIAKRGIVGRSDRGEDVPGLLQLGLKVDTRASILKVGPGRPAARSRWSNSTRAGTISSTAPKPGG